MPARHSFRDLHVAIQDAMGWLGAGFVQAEKVRFDNPLKRLEKAFTEADR